MIYFFESCVFDKSRRELKRDGVECPLEPQVYDLLEFLIENRDRVVSRDELLQRIAGGRFASDAVLGTRVNLARKAIGDSGTHQRLIRTFRGKGLRFIGNVREQKKTSLDKAGIKSAFGRFAGNLRGIPAIAVMPFMGSADDPHWMRGVFEEEVANALSTLGWLAVVSTNTSFAYVGSTANAKQAGRALNAQYLVEGRVRKAGDRVLVSARLVDVETGYQVWGEQFDRQIANVFLLHSEIGQKVARATADHVFTVESARARLGAAAGPSVWQCIVRALSLIKTRRKIQVNVAEALLRRLITAEPQCAMAYSLLSFVYTLRVHMGWQSRNKVIPTALRFAESAHALDPDEPWAYIARGYAAIYKDSAEALHYLSVASELDARSSMAHYLTALASAFSGDCEKAFMHADLAEQLKPYDLLARGNIGADDNVRATTCFIAGRYNDGIAYARRVIARSPMQVPAYRQIVVNSAFMGNLESAKAALRVIKCISPRLDEWMEESANSWTRKEDFQKYVEAFRMAGLR